MPTPNDLAYFSRGVPAAFGTSQSTTLGLDHFDRSMPAGFGVIPTTTAFAAIISDSETLHDAVSLGARAWTASINDGLHISETGGGLHVDLDAVSYFDHGIPFGKGAAKSTTLGLDHFDRGQPASFGTRIAQTLQVSFAAYLRTYSESEALHDAVIPVGRPPLADAEALTDSVSASVAWTRSVSDSLGSTDSGLAVTSSVDPLPMSDAVVVVKGKAFTDPLPITDAVASTKGKGFSDALPMTDSVLAVPGHFPPIQNPLGITDAVTRALGHTATDPLGITDAVVRIAGKAQSLTNPLGLTDATAQTSATARSISNPLTLSDAVQAAGSGTFSLTIAEAEALTDARVIVTGSLRSASDPLGLSDAATRAITRLLVDPQPLTDSMVRLQGFSRAAADSETLTDLLIVSTPTGRFLAEPVGLSDFVVARLSGDVLISDGVGMRDAVILRGSGILGPAENWRWRAGKTRTRWEAGVTRAP